MSAEKCDLSGEECEPCRGGVPPMPMSEAKKLLENLDQAWAINGFGHLERTVLVKNFTQAMDMAVTLGKIADKSGHHPDLLVTYGALKIEIWTHKISGLSRADFVLAAKFDSVLLS
jgi:4a-hydroxytetrahydrobiopterin dehydratase